jgi:hypothetical protein
MTSLINIIALVVEYVGDLMLCVGIVTFIVLVRMDGGLR